MLAQSSRMANQPNPTKEQIDAARRAGFDAHSTHLPEKLRVGMAEAHVRLSAKRDQNIRTFRDGVLKSRS